MLSYPYRPASAQRRAEMSNRSVGTKTHQPAHLLVRTHMGAVLRPLIIGYVTLYQSSISATFLVMYFELTLEINSIIFLCLTK